MHEVTDHIRQKYGQTARSGLSSQDASVRAVAQAFGYSQDELTAIPAQANMGLSCGNPIATAHLKPGEVVVDLGSGGGLDVFLAAQKVGPTGKAIGIDMTQDMIDLARENAQQGPGGKPYTNVAFHSGLIDQLPLADDSADVILSNCVINLAPDKPAVFREMFRVLKPGGRVAVSDIALKQTLPEALATNMAALVGCIAGAIKITDYEAGLHDAGFEHVAIVDAHVDLTAYAKVEGQSACCTPDDVTATSQVPTTSLGLDIAPSDAAPTGCCGAPTKPMHAELGDLFARYDVNAYAASVKVFAVKPG